ncbi:UNVERIFIED_CONTAM: hypothetical protein NCL1_09992 [Trichonephila clavipes]
MVDFRPGTLSKNFCVRYWIYQSCLDNQHIKTSVKMKKLIFEDRFQDFFSQVYHFLYNYTRVLVKIGNLHLCTKKSTFPGERRFWIAVRGFLDSTLSTRVPAGNSLKIDPRLRFAARRK